MYEYSWYEVPYWYEYLLPACAHAQGGRQEAGIPNKYRTHTERIPNASREKMRAQRGRRRKAGMKEGKKAGRKQ